MMTAAITATSPPQNVPMPKPPQLASRLGRDPPRPPGLWALWRTWAGRLADLGALGALGIGRLADLRIRRLGAAFWRS